MKGYSMEDQNVIERVKELDKIIGDAAKERRLLTKEIDKKKVEGRKNNIGKYAVCQVGLPGTSWFQYYRILAVTDKGFYRYSLFERTFQGEYKAQINTCPPEFVENTLLKNEVSKQYYDRGLLDFKGGIGTILSQKGADNTNV